MDFDKLCRVEISGWDEKENFFVEKVYLEPEGDDKKEIALKNSLREGCVLFVRVLKPMSAGNNFPVAYQAVDIAGRDGDGRTRVGLIQLHTRARTRGASLPFDHASIKVA
ncbi:MAG: hypothetical protein ACRD5M_02155 [Candidatus Acidiferrales bacterium]